MQTKTLVMDDAGKMPLDTIAYGIMEMVSNKLEELKEENRKLRSENRMLRTSVPVYTPPVRLNPPVTPTVRTNLPAVQNNAAVMALQKKAKLFVD